MAVLTKTGSAPRSSGSLEVRGVSEAQDSGPGPMSKPSYARELTIAPLPEPNPVCGPHLRHPWRSVGAPPALVPHTQMSRSNTSIRRIPSTSATHSQPTGTTVIDARLICLPRLVVQAGPALAPGVVWSFPVVFGRVDCIPAHAAEVVMTAPTRHSRSPSSSPWGAP